ncbi:hypothetical protein MPOCJGCO_3888 [Methylobacterium trifolii]|uniref:Uncharacterized protein n=1 Tax=Methylobacterium trifolii TaxID=1003092 RepID=A0ABQ4U5U5_9HYPH|nr:hypothetical protein MPOCJGCO_3888 [Methylobacterium trifolii]
MAKPITLTNRIVDAVVIAGVALVLIVHTQLLVLPPHFV